MRLELLWPFSKGRSKRQGGPVQAVVVKKEVQQLLLAGDDTSLAALSKCLKERPELIGNSRCSAPNASATLFTLAAQSGRIRALELLHGMFLSPQCPYAHLPEQELHAKLRKRMDAGDGLGRTPLHHACAMGHADVVVWLLDKGADPRRGDQSGMAALHHAAKHGQWACIQLLLDRQPLVPDAGSSLRRLLDQPSMAGLRPLHFAVANNHRQCVRLLLEHGADPAAKTVAATSELGVVFAPSSTPLHVAAMNACVPMASLLLAFQLLHPDAVQGDLRQVTDTFGRPPIQILRACEPHTQRRMLQLLDPSTDLRPLLLWDEGTTPGVGATKLQLIAAAVLRHKLTAELDAALPGTGPEAAAEEEQEAAGKEEAAGAVRAPGLSAAATAAAAVPGASGSSGASRRPGLGSSRDEEHGGSSGSHPGLTAVEAQAEVQGRRFGVSAGASCSAFTALSSAADGVMGQSAPGAGATPGLGEGPGPSAIIGASSRPAADNPAIPPADGCSTATATSATTTIPTGAGAARAGSSSLQPARSLECLLGPLPLLNHASQELAPGAHRGRDGEPLELQQQQRLVLQQQVQQLPSAEQLQQLQQLQQQGEAPGVARAAAASRTGQAQGHSRAEPRVAGPAGGGAGGGGESSRACAICFEGVTEVYIGGCRHELCGGCARRICAKATDKPPACPFCRSPIDRFESSSAPGSLAITVELPDD